MQTKKDIAEACSSPSSALPRTLKVWDAVLAVALCHNVTVVLNDAKDNNSTNEEGKEEMTYQASSPDEVISHLQPQFIKNSNNG